MGEDCEETNILEVRFLSIDERLTGGQHDSSPRASKARQMHPKASNVDAYLSRVARACCSHGFPFLYPLHGALALHLIGPTNGQLGRVALKGRWCVRVILRLGLWHSRRAIRSRQETSQQGEGLPLQQLGFFGSSFGGADLKQQLLLQSLSVGLEAQSSRAKLPLSDSLSSPPQQALLQALLVVLGAQESS